MDRMYKQNESAPPIMKAALAEKLWKMTINIRRRTDRRQSGQAPRDDTSPTVNTWFKDGSINLTSATAPVLISEKARENSRHTAVLEGKTVYESTLNLLDPKTIDAMNALVFTCGYTLGEGRPLASQFRSCAKGG